jgi:predicted nucleic acid-binding protein
MKPIIFDTSPIISITMNNLLWLFGNLERRFDGKFYITKAVKEELVDKPLNTKKYEFEALQVLQTIKRGIFKVITDNTITEKTKFLLDLANSCFLAHNNPIQIVHFAEIETLAAALHLKSNIIVVDERTTRLLIEDPKKLAFILKHKLHTKITINQKALKEFTRLVKGIKVIRSIEIVTIAYELGLLDSYIPNMPDGRKRLLDSILWGVKLDGCSVSRREIDQIIKLEK